MTKLEKFALVAEVAGGFAVILSVIYLVVQISDNNRLLRSEAQHNALELLQRPLEIMIQTDELAQNIDKCDAADSDFLRPIVRRCNTYSLMQFNGWEYTYYQSKDESIPQELWRGVDSSFRNRIRVNPGYLSFGERNRVAFSDPFRSYVELIFQGQGGT